MRTIATTTGVPIDIVTTADDNRVTRTRLGLRAAEDRRYQVTLTSEQALELASALLDAVRELQRE